jgi:sugar phosphate isomerase/epimerase
MKFSMCLSATPAKFDAVPFTGDFARNLQLLASMGFDGVELAIRNPKEVDMDELLTAVHDVNLCIPAIGTGQAWGEEGLSFTNADPIIREKAISRVISHMPLAKETGAVIIIGLLRGILKQDIPQSQGKQWLYEAFSRCCEEAEVHNVKIAFEPINRYETNLLNNTEEGLQFIDNVGSSNLGMLLDTFHMNIEEPSIERSIKITGNRIFHFHYADSNRNYPGNGHLDFHSILKSLNDIGYSGFISGEHRGIPDAEVAARKGLIYLKKIQDNILGIA